MKLEDIEVSWQQDCKIDPSNLAVESLKIPELHHKYFMMFIGERGTLKAYEQKYRDMYKLKYEYYMGIMDEDELKANGWEPNPLKILKQDLPIYMESDKDLSLLTSKIEFQKDKVNFLESVVKMIPNRGFLIKNAIDFLKFTNGQ